MRKLTPGKLIGLRHLADENGRFKMLAVDQRPPIEELVAKSRSTDTAAFADVRAVKQALIDNLAREATAVLVDPQYLFPSVVPTLPPNTGLLITLEYDRFEETPGGRLSSRIPDWTVGQIKRGGGDAVKLLAWYRPDASPRVLEHQQAFAESVGRECERYDIPFVFELLVYPLPGDSGHTLDYIEHPAKRSEHVFQSVETFAHQRFGVDLFKLESPLPADRVAAAPESEHDTVAQAFSTLDQAAGRPWVVLSAGASKESFRRVLGFAYEAGASGYLAGRAIWWDECVAGFPELGAVGHNLVKSSVPYMRELNRMTDSAAHPFGSHASYGPGGPQLPEAGNSFRHDYRMEAD
jgi:tagatose 1,6-diphosphate aldolase